MSITFYPQVAEGANPGSIADRIELLIDGAQRYKAVVLEVGGKAELQVGRAIFAPKDIPVSFNWDLIAGVLREVREMPEGARDDRQAKAEFLTKLAEIYEVLRAARMARLEAIRLALMSEASQLRGGSSANAQVA